MVYELSEVYGCCFLVATVEGWSLRYTCSWWLAVGAAGVKCSGSQFKFGRFKGLKEENWQRITGTVYVSFLAINLVWGRDSNPSFVYMHISYNNSPNKKLFI